MDTEVWTQRELAGKVGKSQPWLVKILSGENALRLDDIDRVAKALGWPPAELIREGENELIEVTPSELRLLRAFRASDMALRLHFLAVLEAASDGRGQQKHVKSFTKKLSASSGGASLRLVDDSAPALRAIQDYLRALTIELGAVAAGVVPHRDDPAIHAEKPADH